jgi:hypothetical protein
VSVVNVCHVGHVIYKKRGGSDVFDRGDGRECICGMFYFYYEVKYGVIYISAKVPFISNACQIIYVKTFECI